MCREHEDGDHCLHGLARRDESGEGKGEQDGPRPLAYTTLPFTICSNSSSVRFTFRSLEYLPGQERRHEAETPAVLRRQSTNNAKNP